MPATFNAQRESAAELNVDASERAGCSPGFASLFAAALAQAADGLAQLL